MRCAGTAAMTALWALLAALWTLLAACATGGTPARPATPPAPPPAPALQPAPLPPQPTPAAPPSCVEASAAAMSWEARAGQLLLVGLQVDGPMTAQFAAVEHHAPGGVLLVGRSSAGLQDISAVTAELQRAGSGAGTGLLVAVDQEGGQVQVLSGPGFSDMPSAAVQGEWSTDRLRAEAAGWGRELQAAGVHVVLGPVADVLSAELGEANAPIGRYDRAFGTEPDAVAEHVAAFVAGMRTAGIATTVKHFPGLGRVRGNTDYSAGVTDTETAADDPAFAPFAAGVAAGSPYLMMSSATYSRIDPEHRAVFSPVVLRDLVRGTLGFPGVIVSDDLGNAEEVAEIPAGQRAVDFIAAGGDLVVTVDRDSVGAMVDAIVTQAHSDPAFAGLVDASVRRVLTAKEASGLLACR